MTTNRIVALVGGTVIDGTGAPPQPDATLLIDGKRISAVGPDVAVPEGAEVIDVSGKSVLPGLIDFHGHLYARATADMRSQFEGYPKLYLAGGITTVRTPGDFDPEGTVALRERIAAGEEVGPRVFTAGPYFDHAPSSVRWITGIESVQEALEKFELWRDKIDEVKVYTRIHEDEFAALAEAARAAGLPMAAHLGSITAARAIELGLNRLEHAIFAMPEFYGGTELDQYGSDVPRNLAALDIDGPLVNDLIEKIVTNNVTVCPTTTVFQIQHPSWTPLTPDWERYFSPEGQAHQQKRIAEQPEMPAEEADTLGQALEKQLAFVKKLHDAGGLIVAGTDPVAPWMTPGYGLHSELGNLVAAGLTPLEALKAATLDAARALHREADFGSLEAGKLADLVVVDGDPATRIEDIGQTALVFTEGTRHDPQALREAAVGSLR